METTIIQACEDIIRDLTNSIASPIEKIPFRNEIIKKLKFSKPEDWNMLCSLMDVLGDTELAKENYLKYGLRGPTKFSDVGEQYLRLYGITNAINLQRSAVISFIEIIKFHGKKEIKNQFDTLEIMKLRHIVGAHTLDFFENNKKKPYQYTRANLVNDIIETLDSDNKFYSFNLKKLVHEFTIFTNEILIKATEKYINTVLKSNSKKKVDFLNKLEHIKSAQEGNLTVIKKNGEDFLTISYVPYK
ncbi:MAG: hypothetical protein PHN88_12895 [Ignavibacteria bacterium]|nr:hypothetical protein [Ignavibacteria bacterium]